MSRLHIIQHIHESFKTSVVKDYSNSKERHLQGKTSLARKDTYKERLNHLDFQLIVVCSS